MDVPSDSSELLPAGPATAVTLSLAAGLAELTARVSGDAELAARARALREAVAPLGAEDSEAYAAFLAEPGDAAARERTIAVPLRMAELGAEIAETAALAAERGRGAVRADAAAGALLAEACAKTAASLVAANLGGVADERSERSREHVARAGAAAERAFGDSLPQWRDPETSSLDSTGADRR